MTADPAQPGDRIGPAVEAPTLPDPFHEGLLGQLFGQIRVTSAAGQQVAIDARQRQLVPDPEFGLVRHNRVQAHRLRAQTRPHRHQHVSRTAGGKS